MNPYQKDEVSNSVPPDTAPEDFLEYLARKLGVDQAVARARLSDWLCHYDPRPPAVRHTSGVRKAEPAPASGPVTEHAADELETRRSA